MNGRAVDIFAKHITEAYHRSRKRRLCSGKICNRKQTEIIRCTAKIFLTTVHLTNLNHKFAQNLVFRNKNCDKYDVFSEIT